MISKEKGLSILVENLSKKIKENEVVVISSFEGKAICFKYDTASKVQTSEALLMSDFIADVIGFRAIAWALRSQDKSLSEAIDNERWVLMIENESPVIVTPDGEKYDLISKIDLDSIEI